MFAEYLASLIHLKKKSRGLPHNPCLSAACFIIVLSVSLLASSLPAALSSPFRQQSTYTRPLPAEQAFQIHLENGSSGVLTLYFQIAPGTYLYKNSLRIETNPTTESLTFTLPEGEPYSDPVYGTTLIFKTPFTLSLQNLPKERLTVSVYHQGCSAAGFCYPPQENHFSLNYDQGSYHIQAIDKLPTATGPTPAPQWSFSHLRSGSIAWSDYFAHYSPLWILPIFLLLGLLLSFTPCVLPMIPILSGIILSAPRESLSTKRAFFLCCAYALGMVSAYVLLGVSIASLGIQLSAFLQQPLVLMLMSLFLCVLALSQCDIAPTGGKVLQLFSQIGHWIPHIEKRLPKGTLAASYLTGLLSFLIVSPCTTPVLVGILTFMTQSQSIGLGASALALTAFGMSLPLIIFGTLEGRFLPKHGAWMRYVKYFFAMLLFALSLQTAYLALRLYQNPPLPNYYHSQFTEEKSLTDFLHNTPYQKPVVLDFYADWCVYCIDFEKKLANDSATQQLLEQVHYIKVDITDFQHFQTYLWSAHIFAPPQWLFIDADGIEREDLRLFGDISTEQLRHHTAALLEN